MTWKLALKDPSLLRDVAPVFHFKTEEEAIRLANDTEFGLAAYFYGRDIGRIWRIAEALEGAPVYLISDQLVSPIA